MCAGRYWEGCPPAEEVDRIDVSFPNLVGMLLGIRLTKAIADADKSVVHFLKLVSEYRLFLDS